MQSKAQRDYFEQLTAGVRGNSSSSGKKTKTKQQQKPDLSISTESSMKTFAQWVSVIKTANTSFAYIRKMENNRNSIPKLYHKSIVLFKLAMLFPSINPAQQDSGRQQELQNKENPKKDLYDLT